jgi:hypothetical protein
MIMGKLINLIKSLLGIKKKETKEEPPKEESSQEE